MEDDILKKMQTVLNELSIEIQYDSELEILDSISFINLVVFLEDEYDIKFDDEMFLVTKFSTVRSMVEYVRMKITG